MLEVVLEGQLVVCHIYFAQTVQWFMDEIILGVW